MLRAFHKKNSGFTLIELMIVVAIVGILAAIAVPNFITYRNKSRIASAVGSIESVRAAIAAFAADSPGNTFPAPTDVGDYAALVTLVNANGGSLKEEATDQGFKLDLYEATQDADSDIYASYTMTFTVLGVPGTQTGSLIEVTPSGIEKKKQP